MNHRFSKARVNVKSAIKGATITAIGDVEIASSYADLSVSDGALSKGAALAMPVNFPDDFPTESIDGDETHLVYPGVRVNIASMTVEVSGIATPVTLTGLSLGYNLTGGKRYVLEVNVRRSRWARSNIYWVSTGANTGYLTFDVVDAGHQGYQGVFFRWGSLVGVSPAQTNGSDSYSTNTPVYIPTYMEGGTSTWSTPATSPSWANIPYLSSSYDATPYGIDNTYVMDAARNTTAMYDSLRGDICQYLGKTDPALYGYRLPIQNEMVSGGQAWNTTTPTEDGWIKGDGSFVLTPTAGYADGRADFLATQQGTGYDPAQPTNGAGVKLGAAINQELGVVFPVGGLCSGALFNVGVYGYNWSCSALSATNAWELVFGSATVGSQSSGISRSSAMPVRCIRREPGEL
jgi:hypothetical protein